MDETYVITVEEIQRRKDPRTRDKKARSLSTKICEASDYDENCHWGDVCVDFHVNQRE